MALQYFDRKVVCATIVDAWQSHFNTEADPADGQWFTNGPNNNGGLFGQLTDTLASELIFDESQKIFTPNQVSAATAVVDNRNGLTPEQTVTLSYSYQDSTSSTHSTTNSLKASIGVEIKGKASLAVVGAEVSYKFGFEYGYSWTDATTTSSSETKSFSQAVPVKGVPKGRVYQVVLSCNKNTLKVPYRADVVLSGTTSACFERPVNGQSIWTVDAGTLCEWINQYGSAGGESYKYRRNPNNSSQGLLSLLGTMTATQTMNFRAATYDITDSFTGPQSPSLIRSATAGAVVAPSGKLISTTQL